MKRTGIIDIKDILQHRHDLGLLRAQIAAAVGVSAGTVSHILDRASAAGLSWPLPADLDDEALWARLYPPSLRDSGHVLPGCCHGNWLGSCPVGWCKSGGRLTGSGGLSRTDQAASGGSLTQSSWLIGAVVSRVM